MCWIDSSEIRVWKRNGHFSSPYWVIVNKGGSTKKAGGVFNQVRTFTDYPSALNHCWEMKLKWDDLKNQPVLEGARRNFSPQPISPPVRDVVPPHYVC
jgi:hypothetical protein